MQQTPLITRHRAAGAKLVDFAGWEMPIQYSGVVDEYHTVRSHAGLFDVSHMGRLVVSGSGATAFLQRLTTNNVARLSVGQAHYSMVCNEQGGIKDDIFVYRTADAEFLLCVNASNRLKILDWIRMHHRADHQCRIEDRSADLAQIAIQGPASMQVMLKLGFDGTGDLKLHHTCQGLLAGIPCFIARTGYTGEPGYELNVEAAQAPVLWDRMIDAGRPHGVKPAGLGARDLLRLEMGYLLYGNDIEEDRTPLEANAVWTVNFEKGDFMGRSALLAQAQAGISRRLVGFELLEKAVPRHAFKILSSQPHVGLIGEVTSGNFSPLLQKGIGLGYVPFDYTTSGGPLMIDVRGKLVPARVVKPPFYKRSS
jgi:aminomethyltransferase